jgi:hypothetical protein
MRQGLYPDKAGTDCVWLTAKCQRGRDLHLVEKAVAQSENGQYRISGVTNPLDGADPLCIRPSLRRDGNAANAAIRRIPVQIAPGG